MVEGMTRPLPELDVEAWPAEQLPALVAVLGSLTTRAAARLAIVQQGAAAPDADRLLDVDGIAALLGVPPRQVRSLMACRALPVVEVGGRYRRVKKADLLAWVAAHRRPVAAPGITGYVTRHDKNGPAAPQAPAQHDPASARGRARRAVDHRLPLGDRLEPPPSAGRRCLTAVGGTAGGEPLDVGAADAPGVA
jgi:excisionase family DNA binding protein